MKIVQIVKFQVVYIFCYFDDNWGIYPLLRGITAWGRLARTVHIYVYRYLQGLFSCLSAYFGIFFACSFRFLFFVTVLSSSSSFFYRAPCVSVGDDACARVPLFQ